MSLRRRDFITLLGCATAWPLAARAQQQRMPVIGYLAIGTRDAQRERALAALRQGLSETGYIEGRNVEIDYRWAERSNDQLPDLALELVRRRVSVIVTASGTPTALAAKAATTSIPIVFSVGADPVEIGLVTNLNRPGGNLTGAAGLITAVVAKRVEMLHELVPSATTLGLLTNPANPTLFETETKDAQNAAQQLGVGLLVVKASNADEIFTAFEKLGEQRVGGLVVTSDASLGTRAEQIVALAARHALPAIYLRGDFATAGGLISYGPNVTENARIEGVYAGRILKGAHAGDLPVQQLTKFDLVINLKTAKTLGLTVPITLLGRADEVIE
jgi:putative ABC transport system substrate-binding protein